MGYLRHGAARQLSDRGWGLAINSNDKDVFVNDRDLLDSLDPRLSPQERPSPWTQEPETASCHQTTMSRTL